MKESIISPTLFIIGTQRSGTTLLTRILSSHPKYFVQNELPLREIFEDTATKEDILSNMDKQFSTRHGGKSINQFLKKSGVSAWGFKDPQFTEYLDKLEIFSNNAKFILITRDGRGVVNSYMENKWGLGTNVYTGALRWKKETKRHFEFMEKYKDIFLHIRFEDLIEEMELTIQEVCNHIGISFDPCMLEYFRKKSDYKKKKENANTYRKPDSNISLKWKRKLSERQISIIESIAHEELCHLGYELVGSPIHLKKVEVLYYKLHQSIIGWMQHQYQWRKGRIKFKYQNKLSR